MTKDEASVRITTARYETLKGYEQEIRGMRRMSHKGICYGLSGAGDVLLLPKPCRVCRDLFAGGSSSGEPTFSL